MQIAFDATYLKPDITSSNLQLQNAHSRGVMVFDVPMQERCAGGQGGVSDAIAGGGGGASDPEDAAHLPLRQGALTYSIS